MSIDQEIQEQVRRKYELKSKLDIVTENIHLLQRSLSLLHGEKHQADLLRFQEEIEKLRAEQNELIHELDGLK